MKITALWSKMPFSTILKISLSRQSWFWTFILCPFSKFLANSFCTYFYFFSVNYLNYINYLINKVLHTSIQVIFKVLN